jgi:hypothetical protein
MDKINLELTLHYILLINNMENKNLVNIIHKFFFN